MAKRRLNFIACKREAIARLATPPLLSGTFFLSKHPSVKYTDPVVYF